MINAVGRLFVVLALAFAGCGIAGRRSANARTGEQRLDQTLVVDGRVRSYTLVLPAAGAGDGPLPLIIGMHGGGGNSRQFETSSGLTPKALDAGFAVVYPNGTSGTLSLQTWNGGGCCGSAVASNVDDVKFIRQLLITLTAAHNIDARRVYATGMSNGGIMSHRLACELPGQIAAIAPVAGPLMLETCAPTRPVAVLHIHSVQDNNVPVDGGLGDGLAGVPFPPVHEVMTRWAAIDGCNATPATTVVSGQFTRTVWSACARGAHVEYYLTADGGHSWPGGLPGRPGADPPSTAIDANDLAIAFFNRHQLPPARVWLPTVQAG